MRTVEAFRTIARDKLQHTRLWRVCNRPLSQPYLAAIVEPSDQSLTIDARERSELGLDKKTKKNHLFQRTVFSTGSRSCIAQLGVEVVG